MSNELIIRPIITNNQRDYRAITALHNYAYPEEQRTFVAYKVADKMRDAKLVRRRWIAEQDNVIKGAGTFEHWESFYHPNKYLLHIIVDQQYQRNGIGTALYLEVMRELEAQKPQFAKTWIARDNKESVRFAEKRGFVGEKLKWNIILDVENAKTEPFAEQMQAVVNQGIAVKSVAELKEGLNHQRKLYDLYVKTLESINAADESAPPTFEEFADNKTLIAENSTLIAVDKERYVGMWQLEDASGGALYGGIMSVDEDYRRRGVAFALAFQAIIFAQKNDYKILTAHTDEHNVGILHLSERLGFTHLPTQILFSKQF
ncbi:MAG: GNAT family N-acetyltransferase [Pyrinomonadaceae bacterium]|nr:GNAT family N-acetyltransferase [Pyrinomonadaceae bacterium]